MFNTQLKDYVAKYSGFFDESFCNEITKSLSTISWDLHGYYNSKTKEIESFDHELSVSKEQVPLKAQLDEQIWKIIEQYVLKDMSYMKDWFCGWTGYSLSRFNRYNESTKM